MGEGRGEGGQQRAPGVPTGRRGRRRRGESGGERLRGGRGGCSSCRCRRHSDRAAAAAAAAAAAPDVDDVEPVERGERVGAVRGAAFLCFFFCREKIFFQRTTIEKKILPCLFSRALLSSSRTLRNQFFTNAQVTSDASEDQFLTHSATRRSPARRGGAGGGAEG